MHTVCPKVAGRNFTLATIDGYESQREKKAVPMTEMSKNPLAFDAKADTSTALWEAGHDEDSCAAAKEGR